jgi:PTS system N-acetylglucosamine-specific IIC component
VTEPIEFTFMFLAPLLYGVHAVLTGLAMVLMHQLGVRLGFSFSAGLFDYVINFGQATRPWLLLPGRRPCMRSSTTRRSRFVIVRFALRTPGREERSGVPGGARAGILRTGGPR